MKGRISLVALIVVLFMTGCATVSSIYDGARPNKTVENRDGTTTFEFLFPASDFDVDLASKRIDEYVMDHGSAKGYTDYDLMSVNGSAVEKTNGAKAALSMVAGFGAGYSGHEAPKVNTGDRYMRILFTVRYK